MVPVEPGRAQEAATQGVQRRGARHGHAPPALVVQLDGEHVRIGAERGLGAGQVPFPLREEGLKHVLKIAAGELQRPDVGAPLPGVVRVVPGRVAFLIDGPPEPAQERLAEGRKFDAVDRSGLSRFGPALFQVHEAEEPHQG